MSDADVHAHITGSSSNIVTPKRICGPAEYIDVEQRRKLFAVLEIL
jgi:hypothetical protein